VNLVINMDFRKSKVWKSYILEVEYAARFSLNNMEFWSIRKFIFLNPLSAI